MVGWTSPEEQDILEYWFAGTALPVGPITHIGLFTVTPADDATGGTEVTGGAYARQAYAKNTTNWGSSSAGSAGNPATIANEVAITFPEATANWGTVKSWGYFTASTAGTLLYFADLDTNKAVDNGDTAKFAVGALVGKLGDPGDSY